MALARSITALLAVAGVASSTATTKRSVVHEKRNAQHEVEWARRDRAPQHHTFEMRIGMTQRNLHRGYELLMDVSDPRSPNYGSHWGREEITEMFSPSQETVRKTKEWVVGSGIGAERIAHAASGGWLVFNASVSEAEKLLESDFWVYENADGRLTAGCDEYKVPAHLSEHIDFVYPGVMMAERKASSRTKISGSRRRNANSRQTGETSVKRQAATNCSQLVTPQCIADMYNIPPADKAHSNNSMGIYQRECWYQYDDLDLFFETYTPGIPQGTRPQNLSIDLATWHYNESDTSISIPAEGDLDLEVAYPIIYPQNITVFQVDDEYYHLYTVSYRGLFNTFLDAIDGSYCNYSAYGETGDNPTYDASYPDNNLANAPGKSNFDPGTYKGERMCGVYEPTNVISMSYGLAESTYSINYQKRQCDEWMKLGLQGVTVVASSGDSGPLASQSCQASNLGSFYASSPGNCPYVTSVGATMLTDNGTEVAAMTSSWATSGGFSWYFAAPDYQASALATYFADHDPTHVAGYFNRSGRGFPDLAAIGESVAVAVAGQLDDGAGTSAATPLVGALFNRINEERLAAGLSTVGFVNPVLYAHPEIFNDIVAGNNSMCGLDGFSAVEGWDPTTGLGTPDYAKLLEVFMALP